jgi:uncharacterized tellurite resistance protein B-like protein
MLMSERDVILKLARVIIGAAWADGEITNDEINSLKDLLFRLPQIGNGKSAQLSGQEWARLEMYIETPVGADERARLVADLHDALQFPEQKALVLQALENMIEADGVISDSEREVVNEIVEALNTTEKGFFSGLQRLVGGAVQRRSEAVANAPNREEYFDDFIKNKVYYSIQQRLSSGGLAVEIPDEELRLLSLAGGLMAKIAHIDRQVTDEEFKTIAGSIRDNWQVSDEAATFVAEIAVSAVDVTYDPFRMMRELAGLTTEDQRRRFLAALFAVANADGEISFDETEEIRLMAKGLNLTHRDFIDAKLEVLGEQRPI